MSESAEARTEERLRAIASRNPALGAFVEVTAQSALAAAREADRRDVEVTLLAVKDNIDVAGARCAGGMQAYRDRTAPGDAPVVAQFRKSNAVILGKTLMDEAALGALGDNPWFGRCHNPHRAGYTPGGSSAGSAAAVAAGLCDAALGTDTLGSVRIPASYCGVVGFIPSPGIFSLQGVMPLAPSFDRVGVLAPWVREAARLSGFRLEERRCSVGVLKGLPVSDEGRALSAAGYRIEEIDATRFDWRALRLAMLLLIEREAAQVHAALLADPAAVLSMPLRAALDYGRKASAERLARAQAVLMQAKIQINSWLSRCEVLLLPSTPQPAFAFDAPVPENQADYTAPANLLGLPAISVPARRRVDGLPIGVQLVGRRGADALLLGAAATLE